MNYFLTDQQKEIQQLARKIAREKIEPDRPRVRRRARFPARHRQDPGGGRPVRRLHPRGVRRPGRRHHGDVAWSSRSSPRPAAASPWPTPPRRWAPSRSSSSAPTSRRRSTCPASPRARYSAAFALTEPSAGSDAGAHPDHGRRATATTTSSTAPSSGSPTAARPTSTPSSP